MAFGEFSFETMMKEKKKKMEQRYTPGGMGPWFVVLACNTSLSSTCKKHTHLMAHTMPHLAIDCLKRGSASEFWVILHKVGPFEDWKQCVSYLQQWNAQTRGRLRRIERGWLLYQQHKDELGLSMWSQTLPLDSQLKKLQSLPRPVNPKWDIRLRTDKAAVKKRTTIRETRNLFQNIDKSRVGQVRRVAVEEIKSRKF